MDFMVYIVVLLGTRWRKQSIPIIGKRRRTTMSDFDSFRNAVLEDDDLQDEVMSMPMQTSWVRMVT